MTRYLHSGICRWISVLCFLATALNSGLVLLKTNYGAVPWLGGYRSTRLGASECVCVRAE